MRIKLDHNKCIGCGSCQALCPEYFEMAEDGKSHIAGSVKDANGNDELEADKIKCAELAVQACPVQCITIEK